MREIDRKCCTFSIHTTSTDVITLHLDVMKAAQRWENEKKHTRNMGLLITGKKENRMEKTTNAKDTQWTYIYDWKCWYGQQQCSF